MPIEAIHARIAGQKTNENNFLRSKVVLINSIGGLILSFNFRYVMPQFRNKVSII